MEIAIIGGGIGGLSAVLALHAQGVDCRIRVYESVREIRPLAASGARYADMCALGREAPPAKPR